MKYFFIIRNQVKIGDRAMLGLGSVVVKDIPENVIAYGNPARPVRKRFVPHMHSF